MKDFKELIENFENLKNNIDNILLNESKILALNAKALSERTIKEKGFGATYSTNPSYVDYFYGSALNNKGKDFVKKSLNSKNESDRFATWAKFRAVQGLQSNFVDLTYTGKMFAGMIPGETVLKDGVYYTYFAHNNKEGADKMNANFERYGDFIGKALLGENMENLKKIMTDNLYNEFLKYLK